MFKPDSLKFKQIPAQEKINQSVDEILAEFLAGQKTKENIAKFFDDLASLKEETWTQKEIKKIMDVLEDDNLNLDLLYPDFFQRFQELLCSGQSTVINDEGELNDSLNARTFKELGERIFSDEKKPLSAFLLELSRHIWGGLFPKDSQLDDYFSQSFVGDRTLLPRLEATYKNSPKDLGKIKKILEATEQFIPGHDEDFDAMPMYPPEIIFEQIENSPNYFVRFGNDAFYQAKYLPMENASLKEKKALLKNYGYAIAGLSDDEIDHDFAFWRRDNFDLYNTCLNMEARRTREYFQETDLTEIAYPEISQLNPDFSAVSRLSQKYGVVYDFNGKIDCFFALDPMDKKRLTLPEVLGLEGFRQDNIAPDKYRLLLSNYQVLVEPAFRRKIEEEFGIQLNNFSIREQIQFLNFLSSRNNLEVDRIKYFFNQAGDTAKADQLKAFLAIEFSEELGEKMVFSDNKKEADFFQKHNKIIEAVIQYESLFLSTLEKDITARLPHAKFTAETFQSKKWAKKLLSDLYDSEEQQAIEEKLRIGADFIISKTLIDLVNTVGLEEVQNVLNEIENQSEKAEIRRLAQYSRSFITPIKLGQESITNLQDFYQEKIEFQNYELNEKMNAKEVELLKNILDKNDKILEAGCGAGRLILELLKAGYDVSGFDFTPKHVKHVKKQNPEAQVAVGDWHAIDTPDESYDAVYSLGRNILHDYSLIDQMQTFKEAARVLKPGGKFIFDIPDRDQGVYRQMVEKYATEMESRGIRNFRYGAIYDSPDGKNFATRYAYSKEDIEQLAKLSGFEIVEIKETSLETGQGDKSSIFILEKK